MMKHLPKFWLVLVLLFGGIQVANACHGVALVNFNVSNNGSSVTVNGSSDPATCGCGPYYMEVELACFSAANFTGNAPSCTAANWNTYPWYRSTLNIPNYNAATGWLDNCVVEPYFPVTINFSQLCPGTTYVLRARERVCGSTSAGPWSATYTFTTPGVAPTFTLSATAAPSPICIGQQSTLTATINGSGGCGSGNPVFTWTPISPAGPAIVGNPVNVSPTVTTTYSVTATGGYLTCYGVTPTTVQVVVAAGPTVGVPSAAPLQICANASTTLTLTGYSANATVTWQFSPTGLPPWTNIGTGSPLVWNPTQTGFYHAVVTNNCGTATSSNIAVTVLPSPNITITPSQTSVCPGQSTTLSAAGGSNPYTWTPIAQTGSSVTVTPSATTTYTVTSTVGGCTGTQTVLINVNPQPTVSITPSATSVCINTQVTLTGNGANTYSWTGGPFLNTLGNPQTDSPGANITYTVVGTDGNGCKDTATTTIMVNPLPVITVTPSNPAVCPNQSATMTAGGATTYYWNGAPFSQTPGGTQTVTPSATSTYTVVGTDANGCIDSTAVTVTVNGNAPANAGPDLSLCIGDSVTLNASGGVTYSWGPTTDLSNAAINNPFAFPGSTMQYTVTVTDANGCTGVDSMTVTVNPLPVVDAGLDAAVCAGANTTLTATGASTYAWTPSATLSTPNQASTTATPAATTTYYVTGTDINTCASMDSVVVTVNPLPVANAGPSQYACNGCVNFAATGGGIYNWAPATGLNFTNINNPTACPPNTITYTLTVIDANGCNDTDQVSVYVYAPLTAIASNDTAFCPNSTAQLNVNAGGGNGTYQYIWSPAAGLSNVNIANPTATPASTTTYTVLVADGCGSPVAVDSITVTVHPLPVPSVTASVTSGCQPLCVNFTGASVPASNSCAYDFGDQTNATGCNPTHCYTTPGTFDVTLDVVDVNGCASTITMPGLITVYPNPVAGITATPDSTSILTPTITFTNTGQGSDTAYYTVGFDSTFVNNNSSFAYQFEAPGTFWVTQYVVTQHGCWDIDSVEVIVTPDFIIYVPNAFTPNDDGFNDFFRAWGDGIDNDYFRMWIFDRWGNQVFASNDINTEWNGHANGGSQVAQQDTYVWRVTLRDNAGNNHEFVGVVNLIR